MDCRDGSLDSSPRLLWFVGYHLTFRLFGRIFLDAKFVDDGARWLALYWKCDFRPAVSDEKRASGRCIDLERSLRC